MLPLAMARGSSASSSGRALGLAPAAHRYLIGGFGIALATVDGHVYQVGDSRLPFTVQSISKAIIYGMALEDQGLDGVSRKVGVEPSGEAFNSISLEPDTGRPLNPMINAGAIATTSLTPGANRAEKWEFLRQGLSRFAGRELQMDQAVYASEAATNQRNQGIAHLLHGYGRMYCDPHEATDLYTMQCALNVTARDMAVMGATLADGGVNPITGIRVVRAFVREPYERERFAEVSSRNSNGSTGEVLCRRRT